MIRHKERESNHSWCQQHYYAQRYSVVRRYLVFSTLIVLRFGLPETTPYTQFKEPFSFYGYVLKGQVLFALHQADYKQFAAKLQWLLTSDFPTPN